MEKEKKTDGIIRQMNRITESFTVMKVLLIAIVIAFAASAATMFVYFTNGLAEAKSQIYVIDGGKTISAHAQDASVSREDEVKDHVMVFHELMFNIPPSMEMIKRNLEKALEMADKSAYRYYNDVQESGFYKRMTQTNSFQQIIIEPKDIQVNLNSYPYQVIVNAVQFINRDSNVSKFTLVTRCKVESTVRSPRNMHGLMIEDFEVMENKLIETRNKL